MGYMDKHLSGIVIAGGDGSVQEAVTGLLRRSDEVCTVYSTLKSIFVPLVLFYCSIFVLPSQRLKGL